MSRNSNRYWVRTMVLFVAMATAGTAIVAEQGGRNAPGDDGRMITAPRLTEAREMAALIAQGQLKLNDAAQLAEKHVKGMALEAACEIQPGEPLKSEGPASPSKVDPPTPPPKPEPSAERRLMYEVPCFANDKLFLVRVDGLAKKVIDVQESKEAQGGPPKP